MREIHNRTLIKGIPDHKLENNLKAYKKGQLLQIAENHQLLMKKSYTKAKIIEQLKPVIIKNAAIFFAQWDSKGTEVLANVANGHLQDVSDETLITVQLAMESGYLFAYVLNSKVTLVLPNDLSSFVTDDPSSIKINEETDHRSLFLRQMENAQKIYGKSNLNHLVSVWNHYFTQTLTVEEATTWIRRDNNY
ncbi:MAG: hypothetical protein ABS916_02680 [Carnobacterium sp.]|uniref:hypothetical protein n=1 Tax=Carnobacterium sp. TaxID=48221 RepID=UPI003314772F